MIVQKMLICVLMVCWCRYVGKKTADTVSGVSFAAAAAAAAAAASDGSSDALAQSLRDWVSGTEEAGQSGQRLDLSSCATILTEFIEENVPQLDRILIGRGQRKQLRQLHMALEAGNPNEQIQSPTGGILSCFSSTGVRAAVEDSKKTTKNPVDRQVKTPQKVREQPQNEKVLGSPVVVSNVGVGLVVNSSLVVTKLQAGGPAERCGRISVGDVLIAVDDVCNAPPQAVASALVGPPGEVVRLTLRPPGSATTRQVVLRRSNPYTESVPGGSSGRSRIRRAGADAADGTITLPASPPQSKDAGVGATFVPMPDGSFAIRTIKEKGAAAASGCLCSGDVILSVDSRAVNGWKPSQLSEALVGAVGTEVKLRVKPTVGEIFDVVLIRGGDAVSSSMSGQQRVAHEQRDTKRTLELPNNQSSNVPQTGQQNLAKVGIGAAFGVGGGGRFVCTALVDGGPAAMSGLLHQGDVLLEINGKNVHASIGTPALRDLLEGHTGSFVSLKVADGGMGGRARVAQLVRSEPSTYALDGVVSESTFGTACVVSESSIGSDVSSIVSESSVGGSFMSDGEDTADDVSDSTSIASAGDSVSSGVGVTFVTENRGGGLVVRKLNAGSRGGLAVGDVVVAVNGVSVKGLPLHTVADHVRGEAGETVSATTIF